MSNGDHDGRVFRYATLARGLDHIRPVLGRHDLAFFQTTDQDESGRLHLTTTLAHGSGEWISSRFPVLVPEAGTDTTVVAAALTCARRYALFALVGIAGDDEPIGTEATDSTTGASPDTRLPGSARASAGASSRLSQGRGEAAVSDRSSGAESDGSGHVGGRTPAARKTKLARSPSSPDATPRRSHAGSVGREPLHLEDPLGKQEAGESRAHPEAAETHWIPSGQGPAGPTADAAQAIVPQPTVRSLLADLDRVRTTSEFDDWAVRALRLRTSLDPEERAAIDEAVRRSPFRAEDGSAIADLDPSDGGLREPGHEPWSPAIEIGVPPFSKEKRSRTLRRDKNARGVVADPSPATTSDTSGMAGADAALRSAVPEVRPGCATERRPAGMTKQSRAGSEIIGSTGNDVVGPSGVSCEALSNIVFLDRVAQRDDLCPPVTRAMPDAPDAGPGTRRRKADRHSTSPSQPLSPSSGRDVGSQRDRPIPYPKNGDVPDQQAVAREERP